MNSTITFQTFPIEILHIIGDYANHVPLRGVSNFTKIVEEGRPLHLLSFLKKINSYRVQTLMDLSPRKKESVEEYTKKIMQSFVNAQTYYAKNQKVFENEEASLLKNPYKGLNRIKERELIIKDQEDLSLVAFINDREKGTCYQKTLLEDRQVLAESYRKDISKTIAKRKSKNYSPFLRCTLFSPKLVPYELGYLTNLTQLIVFKNSSLPPTISRLKKLKVLKISFENLKKVSSEVADLPNLETLDIYKFPATDLPDWIKKITTLQLLLIRTETPESLPWKIGNLMRNNNESPLKYISIKSLKREDD